MTNHTTTTLQALFDVLNKIGKVNTVNTSHISAALPFINDITTVSDMSSAAQAQANEMSRVVVATAMFGPEIGAVYFEDIYTKLYNLLVRTVTLTAGDVVGIKSIKDQIQADFPYSFEKYAAGFIASAADLAAVLNGILISYITLFNTYLTKVDATAAVVATNSWVTVPVAATLTDDGTKLGTLATTTLAGFDWTSLSAAANVAAKISDFKAAIAGFVLASAKKAQINDIVGCFSDLYDGVCAGDKTKILVSAQKLYNVKEELNTLTGSKVDSGAVDNLKKKAEDIAGYLATVSISYDINAASQIVSMIQAGFVALFCLIIFPWISYSVLSKLDNVSTYIASLKAREAAAATKIQGAFRTTQSGGSLKSKQ